MRKFIFVALMVAAAQAAAADVAIPTISNYQEIAKNLKLSQFKGKKFRRKLKIAVFDNGFKGYEDQVNKTLPKDTVYHKGPASEADKNENSTYHGLLMAQIVSLIVKNSVTEPNYELHLFFAYGHTKLADAVETVIKGEFDLVLYSQVWEWGGAGDGKGFINALVNKATSAGIVWINAAGNFGNSTRWAKIDGKAEGTEEYVVFQNKKGKTEDAATITCKPPSGKTQCSLSLVLAWNDFKEDIETGTDKDLDLVLLDGKKTQVAISDHNQVLVQDLANKNSSMIPRELIEQKIDKGTYTARIKLKSKNFSASQDRLRLTIDGEGLELAEPTKGDSVFPPADNSRVITIGASDAANSSSNPKLSKPELSLKSVIRLKDGSNPFSTSTAAAMAAGVATLHLAVDTDRSREDVLKKLKALNVKSSTAREEAAPAPAPAPPRGPRVTTPGPRVGAAASPPASPRTYTRGAPVPRRAASSPGPQNTYPIREARGGNCLPRTTLPRNYSNAIKLIQRGGVAVLFRNRPAILVNFNFPKEQKITVPPGFNVYIYPDGVQVADPGAAASFGQEIYEVIPSYNSPPVCR